MLIAIDGFEASASGRVGVGRFEVELLKSLYDLDKNNSYRVYTPFNPTHDLPTKRNKWEYRMPPIHRLWSQVTLPTFLYLDTPKPDVFFAPVHYAPRRCPAPVVLGIMDLSFLHFPELFKQTDLYKLKNWTAYSIAKAKHIISISQNTKNDILEQYQIDSGRVSVVYPGITMSTATSKQSIEDIRRKYGIESDYLLYIGTLQPRKNLVRLIEAFQKIKGSQPKADRPLAEKDLRINKQLQLVIVGKKGWLYDEIFEKVKNEGLENDVIFTGYVPDEELPALYQSARCFCLVSLYEGFGFPVLEAMKYGCPVVASNVSSLPELVNEAGVFVNPESTEDIAKGIKKVLQMSDANRKVLIEKGKKQVAKFTWEKAAKETLKILEKVGNK